MFAKWNIFSVHYFLWFGALTPIYGYQSVYAEKYANATESQYGLLNAVMPFVGIVARVFFCSFADRHQAYRSSFLCFLAIALTGFGSYAMLPFFVTPQSKQLGLDHSIWIVICIITAISSIAMNVVASLSDTFAVNSAEKHSTSYGKIRVWGALGWAGASLLLSFINQSDKLPFLVPGLLMTIALMVADLVAILIWPYKDDFIVQRHSSSDTICQDVITNDEKSENLSFDNPTVTHLTELKGSLEDNCKSYGTRGQEESINQLSQSHECYQSSMQQDSSSIDTSSVKVQWRLFMEVAKRRKSLFIYMTLFILSGTLISFQWSYFFLYLDRIHPADFAFITGFSMLVNSMLGELPFFIISDYVVRALGRRLTLSLSFLAIGIRYLLYEFLLPNSSMYFVLVSEILQGPSFVLFYVVMTEIGNEYSECEGAITKVLEDGLVPNVPRNVIKLRECLRATMLGLVNSCYEGLGLGIGSIVGGVVIQYYGFDNLWFYSALISLAVGAATSVLALK